jgi:alkylated DNA repair dioxygenase AlkB
MNPNGFLYIEGFLSEEEEQGLVRFGETLKFQPFIMRGQPSRRGIFRFGYNYGTAGGAKDEPAPIPPVLIPVREKATAIAGLRSEDFQSALFTRYEPGAPIGWHRDLPMFGPVVLGISLLGRCTFKLRHKDNPCHVLSLVLEPRSLYVLGGAARSEWEHSIPPAKELRYSITFRSLKRTNRNGTKAGREHEVINA